jgi:hypothetical protein
MAVRRSLALVLLAVLGGSLALVGVGAVAARDSSQSLPPCALPVPFPGDVRIVAPAADLSPELAALSGVWEGNLGENVNPSIGTSSTIFSVPAIRVAVEQISQERARIVFGVGDLAGRPGSWSAGVTPLQPGGRIEFGTTNRVTLTPGGDRQALAASIASGSLRFGTVMTRCYASETYVEPSPTPTPRPTTTPRPTAAPRPTATVAALRGGSVDVSGSPDPAPPGRVLLQDDFTNPASGWSRQSSAPEQSRVGYGDGEYTVARLIETAGRAMVWRREGFFDSEVSLDARLLPPTDGAIVYLAVRRQESGDAYELVVDPNAGRFRLLRRVGTGITNLIPWTPSAAINPTDGSNRLSVRAQGAALTLQINGQEVGRATDETFRDGWLAFGVGQQEQGLVEARFGNLLVTSVD